MNNQEAKFILSSYRPSGIDAGDPLFAEALKQAENDPTLGAWLDREQAYDKAIATKLRMIAPPAELREKILAGGRISGQWQQRGWRRGFWLPLAAAAAAAIAFSAFFWQRPTKANSVLVNFALGDMANAAQHGGHGEELAVLKATLQDPARPVTRPLSIDFAGLAKTGCRTLTVSGHSVLEVCFQRKGTWFHCYIARAQDFSSPAPNQAPLFASKGPVNAVAWTDGAHRFVVAGDVGRAALEQLL